MEGDRERFDRVYRENLRAVTAYVLRRAPSAVVQDVVAETFIVAWRRLDSVPTEPLPWLLGVARKTLAHERRAADRRAALAARMAMQPPAAVEELVERGLDPSLAGALSRLSERDRELVCLVAWERLDTAGAAAVLGCSPLAVRLRLHRARRRLRGDLGTHDGRGAPVPPCDEGSVA